MNNNVAAVTLPDDLYIPPDAMEVMLEVFAGPLDLLLYLVKKHNLDILDIPVAMITEQYMEYIEMMETIKLELVAEYLEMAAMLTEIKSRMLLPKPSDMVEEEDPRAELIRRLQEYERIKTAAENFEQLPRSGRELFSATAQAPELNIVKPQPEINLQEVLLAFKDVLKRVDLQTSHNIERETLSVRDRMSIVMARLKDDHFVEFANFFNLEEGKSGVVVTFLAILEMTKESILELVQSEPYAPIYVRLAS